MSTSLRLGLFGLYSCISMAATSQSLPGYWTSLKKGPFTVGFKSLLVFDSSRTYDLSCGENKKGARPILLNIWYPAKPTKDTTVLKVKDYFNFPADEKTAPFFTKLRALQFKSANNYGITGNMKLKDYVGDSSTYSKATAAAFESYVSSNTIAHRNIPAADGEFPVVIYHMGLDGTIDENSLLLEYLASNGYIVINSAFEETDGSGFDDGWSVGTGDQKATFDDLNFIINYSKQHHLSKSKKVFLMGHSYGANSSISFIGQGNNVDGIVPLDTDFGYIMYSPYPTAYNPFIKDRLKFYKNIPVFCIGRSEARFKMVDSLSSSKRHYLTIPNMKHNDFTSQGAIGRYYCLPYIKDQQLYRQITNNFLGMCSDILKFLNGYAKTGTGLTEKDIHLYNDWTFNVNKPGEKLPFNMPFDEATQTCPTISQFLDIIYGTGMKKAAKIYARCTDTSFKKTETLTNVFGNLCIDGKTDLVLEYLNWMHEQKVVADGLKDIFMDVTTSSLFNTGLGFHYEKADSIYSWMIDRFPGSRYGYVGRLLVAFYTKKGDMAIYCKKILEIEPDFDNSKSASFFEAFFEDKARAVIRDYRKTL